MPGTEARIEVVLGRLNGDLADEVLSFSERRGRGKGGLAIARSCPGLCAWHVDQAGAIVGTSSVRAGTPRPPHSGDGAV